MKIEVKKIDATRRELKLEIPRERVTKKLNEIYEEISKHAKIKGFRPGKAPRHLVEAQHGKLAREEAIKDLIPEAYREAVQKENINPIDLPEIQDVSFKDGIVSFTAMLDIRPEVKIKNYKGIAVQRKAATVTDEELDKTLDFIKKGQGDKEVTLDDAFVRGLGYPSLEEFKTSLKRQLEIDKERHNRAEVENQIVEYLLKESSVALPQATVNKQLEHRLEEAKKRLRSQRVPEEEIRKKEEDMHKDFRPMAEKDIKTFLIMEHIAKEENITIGEKEDLFHKVLEFLLREAKWEEEKK